MLLAVQLRTLFVRLFLTVLIPGLRFPIVDR